MLAFVVGLKAEGQLAGGRVFVGGGDAAGASVAAAGAIRAGARALVSFGLAGGLSPSLPAGSLLVPRFVLVHGFRLAANPVLAAALGGFCGEAVLAGDGVVAGVAGKASLWAATGADIIDLESGAVAEAAAASGLPFAVLRAVCDPAWRALPPAALLALEAGGAIGIRRVLGSVLRRPSQVPGLLALARDAALARRALQGRMATLRTRGALQAFE